MPNTPCLNWPRQALPRINVAGRFIHDDRDFKARYGSGHHSLHQYDYAAVMRLDDQEIQIAAGDVTLTPAGSVARYHLPQPGRHWCVHFEPRPHEEQPAHIPLHTRTGGQRTLVGDHMARISQMYHAGRPSGAAAASATLLELLLTLAIWHESSKKTTPSQTPDAVAEVIALMHRRLDRPITVPQLAQAVDLSQNYLARLFRKRTGMTMPGYLLHARIDRARLLLTTTNLPVKTIAARVGLADPQHFNKQFRKLTGHSPTALRQRGG